MAIHEDVPQRVPSPGKNIQRQLPSPGFLLQEDGEGGQPAGEPVYQLVVPRGDLSVQAYDRLGPPKRPR